MPTQIGRSNRENGHLVLSSSWPTRCSHRSYRRSRFYKEEMGGINPPVGQG